MKQIAFIVLAVVILTVALVVSGTLYIVDERQQVVITQFGEPVGEPVTTPGLKVKVPFIQKANYFDKRFLEWDGEPNQLPTKDKRFIFVDTYARWRITDQPPPAGLDKPWRDFSVVLLSLGEDGHVASLFPEGSVVDDGPGHILVEDAPKPPPRRLSSYSR